MSSSYGIGRQLPTRDPLRFTFLHSTRLENPPQFVSYRVGYGHRPVLRASFNDVFSERHSMSFYELLGIPETGSFSEIKQAYKQLARKYHPDVSPPGRVKEYTDRFIRVQEAYETLSDPTMRKVYDQNMAKGFHLAFSAARMHSKFDEQMDEKSEWKSRWQSQLSELKKRSAQKDCDDNMSWGARIRRERNNDSSSSSGSF